jgi:AbiEi antitoxin C-terminal domain
MANKSRFIVAESRIKAFFKQGDRKVFNKEQLSEILGQNRTLWNLPISMNINNFIEKLLSREILSTKEINFNGTLIKKERYLTSEASVFQVAVSLINKSYLSHFSAVYLHGLTNQVTKTIYISFEQSKKNNVDRTLKQVAIDSAFLKPQRKSTTTAIYEGYTFLLHNGMYSNRSGVYSLGDLPVTNIERTLIDIAVRPSYAGGVDSVLDIYRKAVDKISMNKLIAILDKLNFIYPYHQTIGFYLEKAGLDESKLEVFRQREMLFDFYLTYEMIEKEYNKNWRLYYPKGM